MFLPNCRYRNVIKAIIVICVLAVFAGLIYFTDQFIKDKTSVYSSTTATKAYVDLNAINIGEELYIQKPNTKNILIIGLDIDGKIQSSHSYNNDYNADFLLLANFNSDSRVCKFVEINRDSIVPVQRLDIFGQKVDKKEMQICLSYSYGDGLGVSALNASTAVSDIFYGLNIDYYLILSRDATRLAVDYLGGVEVTMNDNYTDIDPSYTKGSTHLLDSDAAMDFVSARYGTIKGTNTYRMQRQMCLIDCLIDSLHKSDCNFTDLYNSFAEFTFTDIDFAVFSKIVSNIGDYAIMDVVTPTGHTDIQFGYTQFYMDEASIKSIAQRVFYDKI